MSEPITASNHPNRAHPAGSAAVACPRCSSDEITVVEITYRRYQQVTHDTAANTFMLDPAHSQVDAPGTGHAREFECEACEHTWVSDDVGFSLLSTLA